MILSPLFMFHVFWHAPLIIWSAMVGEAVKATRKPTLVVIIGGKSK